jgi:hypothetical protein
VKQLDEGVEILMNDYAESLEEIEVREDKSDERLTRDKMKVLRKYVGKINWLAANTRPDLAIHALELAKKQKDATLKDLRRVNRVVKKVREKECKIMFKKVGDKKDLCILGVGDASYNTDNNSVGGEIIMLGNKKTMDVSPMYWKSGVIRRVCTFPKAAETRSLVKLVDDSVCMLRELSRLMNSRIETRIFTDSRPLLESIGSSGQIEEKNLRQSVALLKQLLEDGEISRYSWIEGSDIVADVFTKAGSKRDVLDEIILENKFKHAQSEDNLVVVADGEIQIKNLVTKAMKKKQDF